MSKTLIDLIRRPWAAAVLALVACLMHYSTSTSVYETAALVQWQADSSDANLAEEHDDGVPEQVLAMAMVALDEERSKAGEALLDVDQVAEQLSVTAGEEDGLWKLRYISPGEDEAELILNFVADACIEYSRGLRSNEAIPKIKQLQKSQQQTEQQLTATQQMLSQLETEMSGETISDSSRQATLERLKAYSDQLAKAKTDRLQAETRYREVDRELETGAAVSLVTAQLSTGSAKEIVQAVMSHADLVEALQHVRETKHELSRFYGARHPRILEVTAKEAELSRQISEVAENTSGIQQAGFQPVASDRRSLLLKSLAWDLRRHQELEDDLHHQLELEQFQLDQQEELQARIQETKAQEAATQQQLKKITQGLASVKSAHQARAVILEPASTLQDPIAPSLFAHLFWGSLAAVLAFFLSRWAFRDLGNLSPTVSTIVAAEVEAEPLPEPEAEAQPPLYARRLMRLARLKQNQDVE